MSEVTKESIKQQLREAKTPQERRAILLSYRDHVFKTSTPQERVRQINQWLEDLSHLRKIGEEEGFMSEVEKTYYHQATLILQTAAEKIHQFRQKAYGWKEDHPTLAYRPVNIQKECFQEAAEMLALVGKLGDTDLEALHRMGIPNEFSEASFASPSEELPEFHTPATAGAHLHLQKTILDNTFERIQLHMSFVWNNLKLGNFEHNENHAYREVGYLVRDAAALASQAERLSQLAQHFIDTASPKEE